MKTLLPIFCCLLLFTASCNINSVDKSEAVGVYHLGFKSKSSVEILDVRGDGNYFRYYEDLQNGIKYLDSGKWNFIEEEFGGKQIEFKNWVFREDGDTTTGTISMLFSAEVFGLKECVVLGRGVDDANKDLVRLR